MPKKTTNTGLLKKLGDRGRKAFDKHKGDETIFDTSGGPPAGIEGGIAKLTSCVFGVFKKGKTEGEVFFRASGSIVHPETFNGQDISGIFTTLGPEPICETPTRTRKTVDDHIKWVTNQLRMLGLETSGIDSLEDLEDLVKVLEEQQPYFRFRTWKGEKQTSGPYKDREPRTNEVWQGLTTWSDDGEDIGVIDETVDETVDETEESVVSDEEVGNDLDSLASAADTEDVTAQKRLTELAKLAGVDPEAVEITTNWDQVAELIRNNEKAEKGAEEAFPTFKELALKADDDDEDAQDTLVKVAEERGIEHEEMTWQDLGAELAKGETGGESEDNYKPEKGEIWSYKPPRARKLVECEVTAVFDGRETCNLKNLDDGKIYKSVAWAKLVKD